MVIEWDVTIPKLSGAKTRKAYIFLPEYYNEDELRRYPVLYMFDGHNIFYDAVSAFGKSWNMTSYLLWTRKPLIVVAVECNKRGNNRLKEYAPISFADPKYGNIRGRGRTYMEWLVKELKPKVDEAFRTMPDREHTIIAGSSMGGLMSLYAVTAHNDVFSRAACLSPSLWVQPKRVLSMIRTADVGRDTVVYMDYGENEMKRRPDMKEAYASSVKALLDQDVMLTSRIVPRGEHCEACWEKQVPIFMNTLMQK